MWLLWPLGALALALPWLVQHPFFDTRWTNWLGLVTHKPVAEDYVPVLPWLGLMLWGLALGQSVQVCRWLAGGLVGGLVGGLAGPVRGLALLGRWPLTVYMLHQPLLIGALMALAALRGH